MEADFSNATHSSPNSSGNGTCIMDSETFLTPYLRWLVPVLVAAGLVGNGFILVIFNSRGMRTKTHFILSAMAAVDLAHALVAMMTNMYLYERIIDSDSFSRFYHHRMKPILMVLVNWLAMTSTWLAVLCTIERFIAIRHPLKAHLMIRKRIIVVATCGIALFSLLVCSYYAFLFRGITAAVICGRSDRVLYRLAPDPKLRIYGHAARQIHSLLCSVVPIALLFYYNGSLVYCLRRNRDPALQNLNGGRGRKLSRRITGQSPRGRVISLEDSRERKVALVVLAITLTTAFLLLPSSFVVVYDAVRYVSSIVSGRPIQTPWWYFHVGDISNTLVMLEKVLDFFLYCFASGSFRRRLVAMCFKSAPVRRPSFLSSPRPGASSAVQNRRPRSALSAEARVWLDGVKYRSLVLDEVRDGNRSKRVSKDGGAGLERPRSSTLISDCSTERADQQSIAETSFGV